jgi:hypothetical protein
MFLLSLIIETRYVFHRQTVPEATADGFRIRPDDSHRRLDLALILRVQGK